MRKFTSKVVSLFTGSVVGFSLCLLMILASCTEKKLATPSIALIADAQKIVNTRPQNSTHFMAVVQLKTPALLTTSSVAGGVRQIDQDQLKAVIAEQDNAIAEMLKISSEVQVIYRYKMVLNAIAVLAPKEVFEKLKAVGTIASWEGVSTFERPRNMNTDAEVKIAALGQNNSLKFVGAEKLHARGLTGKGMKVGILDTGIDYTHAMFKGVGTVGAYKAIDPAKEAAGYPSAKVVGGVDLVGTTYDSGSPIFAERIPKPDMNPLDEGGHGTHVAGTVAGIGDGGLTSYDGMAKDADLYAIKVFGAEGSTSDMVVIAGLEFSADPNGDGDLHDQLDVVNLSLGSGYGNPHILYTEAIKNLVLGGTVAVISAGNSGPMDYIVGAPGTSTEALSVAASIDNGDHNWKFDASEVILPSGKIIMEAMEAATTKPIKEAPVSGQLYFIGLADKELADEEKTALNGKIALIDRGVVNFNDKIKRAVDGGAIGAIVINNKKDEAAFRMGTTDKFDIPAIMITLEIGNKIKAALQVDSASVQFNFASVEKIEKPELIDTLTGFSSKGPRSQDGYLKPEISAPGSDIISAKMGGGAEMVKMSGTSMAAPHMAGIMALIKQSMQQRGLELSALELKNVSMGTAKTIGDKQGRYLVSRQGSGRVQADVAADAQLVASIPSIAFGEMNIEAKKSMRARFEIKSLSQQDLNLQVVFEGNEFVTMNPVSAVALKAGELATVAVLLNFDATKMKDESVREMDGWVKLMSGTTELYRIPVLAVAHRMSSVIASELKVLSSEADAQGSAAEVTLKNNNLNAGTALLFNLLAVDDRKPMAASFMNADCDLQAIGFKIIEKKNAKDETIPVLKFGVKTYKPMTTWNSCDVSILIDNDQDGVAEQELLGASLKSIAGQKSDEFASTLLDAVKARELRKAFETSADLTYAQYKNDPKKLMEEMQKLKDLENYSDAIISQSEMQVFNNSTAVVVEMDMASLAKSNNGDIHFSVVVTHNEQSSVQSDNYLMNKTGDKTKPRILTISSNMWQQSYVDLPESVQLAAGETKMLEINKGLALNDLLVLFPQNRFTFFDNVLDAQAQILKPVYTEQK